MLQRKLILDSEFKIDLIEIEKITYITVDSFSSEIHFVDGTKCNSSKTLSFLESSLPDTFFKISRNTIVNLSHIENVNKLSHKIKIEGDIALCASTRQFKNLIKHLKRISVHKIINI